jgi:hypothetical protein
MKAVSLCGKRAVRKQYQASHIPTRHEQSTYDKAGNVMQSDEVRVYVRHKKQE